MALFPRAIFILQMSHFRHIKTIQCMNSSLLKRVKFKMITALAFICRGKLGNGEHLSLEVYKYKEYNIYVLIIMQHKEHIKFYPETHFYRHNFCR